MFSKIMLPLDFSESDTQQRAIALATELASSHNAELHAISIGSSLRDSAGHTEAQRAAYLDELITEAHARHGISAYAHEIHSVDPSAELDKILLDSIDEYGIDLVVMPSHVPGIKEHFFHAHGGYMASHAKTSVFVVR